MNRLPATRREIVALIEGFYNRQQLHQSLGYLTLLEFERRVSDSLPGVRKTRASSACSLFISKTLSDQWNFDHQSAHDLVHLEVFLRALGMRVVAADAGLADGAIGIDRLKIGLIAILHGVRR